MRAVAPDVHATSTALGLALLVLATILGIWLLAWLLLRSSSDRSQWRSVALAASVGALLVLAVGWLLIGVPALAGFLPGDWIAYHRVTAELSDGVLGGARPSRWQDRAAFFYLMAIPHRLLGSSGFVTVGVNAALVGGAIVLLADATRRLVDLRTALTVAWLAALLPPVALWNGLPLREALALLLVVCGAWIGVRLATGAPDRPWEPVGLLGAAVVVLGITTRTRFDLVPALALLILAALLVRLWQRPSLRTLAAHPIGSVAGAALVAGPLVLLGPRLYRWLDSFADRAQVAFSNLHRIANSAVGPEPMLEPVGPMDLVRDAPVAVARALWGPPPGTMLTVQPLFVLDAAFYWLLTPFLLVGLLRCVRDRRVAIWVLVLPALAWAAVTGLTLGNWGIVSRMRVTSWILLLPIVAVGLVHTWDFVLARRRRAVVVPDDVEAVR